MFAKIWFLHVFLESLSFSGSTTPGEKNFAHWLSVQLHWNLSFYKNYLQNKKSIFTFTLFDQIFQLRSSNFPNFPASSGRTLRYACKHRNSKKSVFLFPWLCLLFFCSKYKLYVFIASKNNIFQNWITQEWKEEKFAQKTRENWEEFLTFEFYLYEGTKDFLALVYQR